jgi:hypothetical protein
MLTAPPRYQNPASHISVIERAASATGFEAAFIIGTNRWEVLCEIRCAIMFVLERRGVSHDTIARLLKRERSTITTGIQRAEKLHAAGGDFARLCEVIK